MTKISIILLVGLLTVLGIVGQVRYAVADFRSGNVMHQENKPVIETVQHGTGRPVEYKLTEIQQLKLQVMQKDAQLLQAQLQTVQRQFQEKVSELMSTAQKVKLENGWPPETQFDPDKLVFSAPTVKEEKK